MKFPSVDMHCHLDLYPDPERQISAIVEHGSYVLSVTTTPRAWHGTSKLSAGANRVKTALGLHPQLARERKGELQLFDRLLPDVRYVGEVGLDGGKESRGFWRDQLEVFDHILRSCENAGGRILSLHSRLAASEVLDALDRHPSYGVAVLHWFTGSQSELDRAIDMGCWFSVGDAMTRSKSGQALVAKMPINRVLTETDGPFGKARGKPLAPAECNGTVKLLAEMWDIDIDSVRKCVLSSFRELVSS